MFWRGPATVSHRLSHNCLMSHVYTIYIYIHNMIISNRKGCACLRSMECLRCSLNISASVFSKKTVLHNSYHCLFENHGAYYMYLFIFCLFIDRGRGTGRTRREAEVGREQTWKIDDSRYTKDHKVNRSPSTLARPTAWCRRELRSLMPQLPSEQLPAGIQQQSAIFCVSPWGYNMN